MPKSQRRRPERIGDLACLPVFHKLNYEKVLVAGGSEAAAWKAELLASAGAQVHVYASELCQEFHDVIAETPDAFAVFPHTWTPGSFRGAHLAVLDTECNEEAMAFYAAGRHSGIPVNVIDNPAFCQFQFGSIVNRSPAIIAISTDGAAPILGQALRRKIETLLPDTLAGWARLAQKIRETVNARLPMGAPRRAFWEGFVDRAFSGAVADEYNAFTHITPTTGHVTLVGAGPGDAELLTIKAMRALQAADVILFDDLVSDDVLELARREAKRILVGKRGGRVSCKQDDINTMMLNLAKAGKHVVRLKSGDPVVFGRAGEEIQFLERNGISADLVPGITAASAMASQLGVSLTHRDHAESVRFVTGHSRNGSLPDDIDWSGVADPRTTTVFYMGGRTAKQIQMRLVAHGLSPETPATIAAAVSRDNRQTWNGVLAELSDGIEKVGFEQPVLIGVGRVFEHGAQKHLSHPEHETQPVRVA